MRRGLHGRLEIVAASGTRTAQLRHSRDPS
jgi:hypothetical protein